MQHLSRFVPLLLAVWLLTTPAGASWAGNQAQGLWIDGANFLRDRDPERAVLLFNRALAAPDLDQATKVFVLQDRGVAWEKLGQSDKAMADFESVIKLSGRHVGARVGLYRVWMAKGQPERALPFIEEALKLSPDTAHLYIKRGYLWLKLEQAKKASWDFEKAVQLEVESREAHFALALAYEKLGRPWKAYDHAKISARPIPSPEQRELVDRIYQKLVKPKKAVPGGSR